jgi:uncharacterized membrane protein
MNKQIFKDLAITFLVLLVVDTIYLYLVRNIFRNQVGMVQKQALSVSKIAFILTYVLMASMFYFLVIDSCATSKLIRSRYLYAFLMGIFVYGVFEFTNKALFINWKWSTVFLDMIWGGLLFLISYVIITEIKKI